MDKKTIATALGGIILGATGTFVVDTTTQTAMPDTAITSDTAIPSVEQAQDAFFKATGDYIQCDEYTQADGSRGYSVYYEDAAGKHQRGFGPQAADRTFDVLNVATSS